MVVVWVLVAGGVAILVRGLLLAKGAPFLTQVMHFTAALIFLGIAGFGPRFIIDSGLADLLRDLSDSPNLETYASYYDAVGSGEVDSDVAGAGLALTLEKPVPDMERALTEAIEQAKDPAGRRQLEATLESVQGRTAITEEIVNGLESNRLTPDRVMRFDSATRDRLAELPPDRLRRLNLSRDELRRRRPPGRR